MIRVFSTESETREFKEGYATTYFHIHFNNDEDDGKEIIFNAFFDENKKFVGFIQDKTFDKFYEIAKDVVRTQSQLDLNYDEFRFKFNVYIENNSVKFQKFA